MMNRFLVALSARLEWLRNYQIGNREEGSKELRAVALP
jgi:hypothetical protein